MAYTEQERVAARRAAWQKYNRAHRAERAAHNKQYVQQVDVKARRRQMRASPTPVIKEPHVDDQCVGPTTP